MKQRVTMALGVAFIVLMIRSGPAATQETNRLELVVQIGHTRGITSLAMSEDAKRILTGSWDNTAILWDAQTGKKLRTFTGHAFGV
ncbi:MAG: hypothetical protein HZA50_13985 [Planctomycetes bacterium]|nr:hypothetical protein [Planctomycetota bacterium]